MSTKRLIDESSDRAVVPVARIHDVDDPPQVVERGELDGDLALALSEVDLHPGLEPVGAPVGDVPQAGRRGLAPAYRRLAVAAVPDRHDLLQPAHADALGDDPSGHPVP